MADSIDPQLVRRIIELLRNFPSDGKPDMATDEAFAAHAAGFIERKEITKSCRSCGTPRFDYSYMKITPAGRIALMLADREADHG